MNGVNQHIQLKQLQDFDLSIVMPFYKRLDELKRVFSSKESYFRRNGIEVIILSDEPSEKDAIVDYIRQYPFISWKVVMNEHGHSWKNPAKAFNVGIRQSTKKYVWIMDPELEFYSDAIYILREYLDSYLDHFAVGQVIFTELDQEVCEQNKHRFEIIPYGSIMAKKEYFEQIGGYNEQYTEWGGEDDNLRMRMELAGFKRLFYPNALLIYREDFSIHTTSRNEQRAKIPKDLLKDMLLPAKVNVNDNGWGTDFNKITYDWHNNPFAKEQCLNYLNNRYPYMAVQEAIGQQIIQYDISDPKAVFENSYRLVVLISTYNESEHIEDCLRNVEKHCDGIIVLDDESSDNTYELIQSDKLLLKAKKKRECFNDRQNRNILLSISSFFKAEWLIFIDADERFDERFVDLPQVMQRKDVDTIGVWIANLWDSKETYRTDMPDTHPYSKNGLWFRWRMFRNDGWKRFVCKNRLHFDSIPYIKNTIISKTLILHLGYLDEQKRISKYLMYKDEDKDKLINYECILEQEIETASVNSISLSEVYPIK